MGKPTLTANLLFEHCAQCSYATAKARTKPSSNCLAAGRPVIATRVGGLVEQLGGRTGALLCDPTAEGVAGAVRDLLAAPPVVVPPDDANAAWEAMAADLLAQLRTLA